MRITGFVQIGYNILMTISVTQDHIRDGRRGGCSDCPIALALADATGIALCSVGYCSYPGVFAWTPKDNGVVSDRHSLPAAVEEFILAFDQLQPVSPFTFEFDLTPIPIENNVVTEPNRSSTDSVHRSD